MSPTEYIFLVLENERLLWIFCIVFLILLLNSWFFYHKIINGLIVLVFTTAMVISVFIDLIIMNLIDWYRFIYFISSEILIYFSVLFLYKRLLQSINKEKIFTLLQKLNKDFFIISVLWIIFGILINFQNVSWDGTSRIAFQTARWFSFYRMLSVLINPIVGLLLIHNLFIKNKVKLSLLLILTILLSVTAGSKSGFVFSIVMSFLFYRDLVEIKNKLKARIYIPGIILIIFASTLNFIYLGIDREKVFERIVHYAESTIMIFPSQNPCSVCENQSTIALVHRGFGRLFNDPSSVNDMNLFGFALSSEVYGGETMTGPNARIGSYSICAFPGLKIFLLYIIFLFVVYFSFFLIRITEKNSSFLFLSVILVVIDTLQHFLIDYNVAMSNFTLIIFIYLYLIIIYFLKFNFKHKELLAN
jgi:hypothetical protein